MGERMTDETAKALADAMNRLAAAIESVRGQGLYAGIQVHHQGAPSYPSPYQQPNPYRYPFDTTCLG